MNIFSCFLIANDIVQENVLVVNDIHSLLICNINKSVVVTIVYILPRYLNITFGSSIQTHLLLLNCHYR